MQAMEKTCERSPHCIRSACCCPLILLANIHAVACHLCLGLSAVLKLLLLLLLFHVKTTFPQRYAIKADR